MADAPNIFVAGLGRCGTTMVMSMLDRGGFPVGDAPPDYETHTPLLPGRVRAEALVRFRGRAVKWIDPVRSRIPAGTEARTIWLDRDPIEQAKSQMKLLGRSVSRREVRFLASALRNEASQCRRMIPSLGPCLFLQFDLILANPYAAALKIREFLGELDAARAAAVVRPRSAACAPDLAMEAQLPREACSSC